MVLQVFKFDGEWAWRLHDGDANFVMVLDSDFTNLVRVYVDIPGNPELSLIGGNIFR
jgi:hypothetical protein